MSTLIEAVYEDGVLKPLAATALKERQRYKLIVQEEPEWLPSAEAEVAPEFLAELERRTTILPDGRKIVRLEGIFEKYLAALPDGEEKLAEAMAEVRRERQAHFEAELDEFFPLEEER